MKDLKGKLMVAENTCLKKNQELETMRAKIEKRLAEEEKWTIRDRTSFEKFFGSAPSQKKGDDKFLNFMRTYENQREKHEKMIYSLEKELDRLNKVNIDLENQNFALSKGLTTLPPAQKKSGGFENDEISTYFDHAL